MTFQTGVVKMGYSEEKISAVLNKSEQARKHRQKLAKVTETVAAYRLREMKNLYAVEELATWRRTHGYDRDDSWMHDTLPLSPQKFTASLWSDLQELKDAISMSGKARPWQKTREFLDGLKGDLPDEELAAIKRYVERRSREAAQVTVTPVSTAQHCIPRSLNHEIPSDVYVNMEEKDEGRMNPELEPPSAGTGIGTPGQQCPPNEGIWETERTIADGCCSLAWDRIREETSLHQRNTLEREPVQLRKRQIHQTLSSGRQATNPKTRIKAAKRTSKLTPVGKETSHRFRARL